MKKSILITLLALWTGYAFTQTQNSLDNLFSKNGEIYFKFKPEFQNDINRLTKIISIDNVDGDIIIANANQKEFEEFLKLGYDYTILPHPNKNFNPKMLSVDDLKNIKDWNTYPTYDAYVAMMYQFETDYPLICDVFSIGQSVQGRELLVAKISDNLSTDEDEPEFLYTSTMHGDETAGYIFMLRLIDSLLTSYGTVPRIIGLINEIEIYINPLANPDGTYWGGNNTVSGAIRRNANSVDLNRNYPDPEDGPHPDGNPWQPETIAFMNFAENHHFVISSNMHGGAEVCNYPWDTWSQYPADTDWWEYVCHEYADTAQTFSPSGYMSGFDDGITNGYAWYSIAGGRQDYMNYFHQCREFTLELTNTKLLSASQLPAYWGYNRRSLLNYMEQVLFGIRGIVTDSITGQPIKAEVFILNHEADSSWVYSEIPVGNYHRPIYAGTYDIQFSAGGYITKVIENVNVTNKNTTLLDVQLVPENFFQVNIKVFLEGPFNGTDMNTDLNSGGFIPLYQPYTGSPWNYTGTESVVSVPVNVVDWVLIELRDTTDASLATGETMIGWQAAFILNNGSVVGLDGSNMPWHVATITNNLFMVIWHRNHLGIISAFPLTKTGGVYTYDFTTGAGQAYNSGQKDIGGAWGMVAGDGNGDGIVDDFDISVTWTSDAGKSGYWRGDFNMNGQTDNIDKNGFWLPNFGQGSQVPD
ncbi:MAG: zinc carboxypeptidase [Bacteroidetes bacterium]|nr:zinc carboxypeptidase [Bacteroidota bacterium]MBL7104206.1 zinc carboxypeptidase [Bacteroidales bacterium]